MTKNLFELWNPFGALKIVRRWYVHCFTSCIIDVTTSHPRVMKMTYPEAHSRVIKSLRQFLQASFLTFTFSPELTSSIIWHILEKCNVCQ